MVMDYLPCAAFPLIDVRHAMFDGDLLSCQRDLSLLDACFAGHIPGDGVNGDPSQNCLLRHWPSADRSEPYAISKKSFVRISVQGSRFNASKYFTEV